MPDEVIYGLQIVHQKLSRIIRAAGATSPALTREAVEAHGLAAYLTRREWQCLELLVQGLVTDAIAEAMSISTTTVRTHIQSLLAELGVNSRLQAVALATRTSSPPGRLVAWSRDRATPLALPVDLARCVARVASSRMCRTGSSDIDERNSH